MKFIGTIVFCTDGRDSALLYSDSGLSPHESVFISEDRQTTEDGGGYLEPRCIDSGIDFDGGGDCSIIEGSIVDSSYFDNLCRPGSNLPPINVDKYMIPGPQTVPVAPNGPAVPPRKAPLAAHDPFRLSVVPEKDYASESEYSDGELFRLSEKERILSEFEQTAPASPSERALLEKLEESDSEDDEKPMKRGGSSSSDGSVYKQRLSSTDSGTGGHSINDLNRSTDAQHDCTLSSPNICCPDTDPSTTHIYETIPRSGNSPVDRALHQEPSGIGVIYDTSNNSHLQQSHPANAYQYT